MDLAVQIIGVAAGLVALAVTIRKELREAERHRWEREDRQRKLGGHPDTTEL